MRRIALSSALVAIGVAGVIAQQRKPTFEVASVRPIPTNVSAENRFGLNFHRGDTFSMTGTVGGIIRFAYGIGPLSERPYAIVEGEPGWKEQFHVMAKTPGQVSLSRTAEGPIHLMMQSLLEERFGLNVHWETRERDGYALVLARPNGSLGPQIRPSSVDCEVERARSRAARAAGTTKPPILGAPMEQPICGANAGPRSEDGKSIPFTSEILIGTQPLRVLAEILSRESNRPIVNQTGLDGNFDVELRYAPEPRLSANDSPSPGASQGLSSLSLPTQSDLGWPRLSDALRDQLGLALQPALVPIDVLVIDSVQQPTEN